MDYNHITNFLDSFKKILFKSEYDHKVISEIITKHIDSPITQEIIKTKGTIIYINSSPIVRSEILVHKQGILKDLKEILPNSVFTDIH